MVVRKLLQRLVAGGATFLSSLSHPTKPCRSSLTAALAVLIDQGIRRRVQLEAGPVISGSDGLGLDYSYCPRKRPCVYRIVEIRCRQQPPHHQERTGSRTAPYASGLSALKLKCPSRIERGGGGISAEKGKCRYSYVQRMLQH